MYLCESNDNSRSDSAQFLFLCDRDAIKIETTLEGAYKKTE